VMSCPIFLFQEEIRPGTCNQAVEVIQESLFSIFSLPND
jgi:hypothetical protein